MSCWWKCESGIRTEDIVCSAGNGSISDNHSIAYCLLGYLCAYYRLYYPLEFITSFLNNAANDDDIQSGTMLAKQKGIKIIQPKFGFSKGEYFFDKEKNVIAKGVGSVKYLSEAVATELYDLSRQREYTYFSDLLYDIKHKTTLDARQLDILIKIDFFSRFGNQRELFSIYDNFNRFKSGDAIQMKRTVIDGTPFENIVRSYSSWITKSGEEAKSYKLLDVMAILRECEDHIKSLNVDDLSIVMKARNFKDIMGYAGYVTGEDKDRNKLYITGVYPVKRKKDGKIFGHSVITHSIGSGKESRMTVFNKIFDADPIKEDDIIICKRWDRDGVYFRMLAYEHLLF